MMFLFDMLGTVAFAVAGALVGVRKKFDIFGIAVLALSTAVGGGIVRDVVISNTPPMAFRNPIYVTVSVLSAAAVVLVHKQVYRYNMTIQVCDALGLGAFTVAGANMAVTFGYNNFLTVAFLAVVTAAGGGVLRDILARDVPGIFRKEIYAVAALAGAVCFYYVYPHVDEDTAMYVCFSVTTMLRLLAMKYNWQLPIV